MDDSLYEMIFKRKSFHLFRNIGSEKISSDELKEIEEKFYTLAPIDASVKVKIKIVKNVLSCRRGQEYCILFYSENKTNYLQNIGYLGEQLDLYLVSKNIGTLWFGIGKAEEKFEGLDFVIMIAIAKIDAPDKFRKDMFKSKRKSVSAIWAGQEYLEIANIARFAPSACNTQPWFVEAKSHTLRVYRYNHGKRGIMPQAKVSFYNQIDMGIFLCFLELCLAHNKIIFERKLCDAEKDESEKILTAEYFL